MKKHISEQYDVELAHLRKLLMSMGGLVERQVNNACNSLVSHDIHLAEDVRDTEPQLNQMEVDLDDECVSIIARRQPTAGDLRAVVSVMKLITDLERIGDEAERIAKIALGLAGHEMPADGYAEFRHIHTDVVKMLNRALDSFARLDVEAALRVFADDEDIDRAYNELVRNCIKRIEAQPDDAENIINLVWAARALERIGDHAKNISEYVIYQVKGKDVRHADDLFAQSED